MTEDNKVLFNGQYRDIVAVKREAERVRLSFNFMRKANDWDLSLTDGQKVYILGPYRVTGLKGE